MNGAPSYACLLPIFLRGSWQCRQFYSKGKKGTHYVRSLWFCFYFQTIIFADFKGLIHILTHPRQLSVSLWKVSAAPHH